MCIFWNTALSDYLARSVGLSRIQGFLPGDRVPDLLTVDLSVLFDIDNCGKRRCDHDSLHCWGVGLNSPQDTCCSLNRGVQEVLYWVRNIVMERRGSMKDVVEGWVRFDSLNGKNFSILAAE
jgi:hypothetical protein